MGKKKKQKKSIRAQKTYINNTPTLSVCMIVKNEEQNLPKVLTSIQGIADEIVVVDTGSTDKTVEIAKSFGAKVYFFEWCDDFSAARNESLKHATKDYILWLDADDELAKEEHEIIRRHLKEKPGYALYLHLKNIEDGRETESIQLRVFPNRKGVQFQGKIHEQVYYSIKKLGIPMSTCGATIVHYGYHDKNEMKKKLIRNRMLQERELLEKPDDIIVLFFLSRTLRGLGEIEDALQYINRIINKAKDDPDIQSLDIFKIALLEKASLLSIKGRMDDSLSLLEKWESVCKDKLIDYTLGELYYKKGEYNRAYEKFLPLIDTYFRDEILPIDAKKTKEDLLNYLGISSLFVKDYACARRCFKQLISDYPDNASYHHYLALTEEKAGNIDEAISICTKAINACDNKELFVKRRFLLLIDKGDVNKAMDEMESLKSLNNDIEVLTGSFLISCMRLHIEDMQIYYRAIQKAIFLPLKTFPEGYIEIQDRLLSFNENKARSLFDRAIDVLMKSKLSAHEKIN